MSKSGKVHQLRVAALHTPVDATVRHHEGSKTIISLPPYTPVEVQPRFANDDFVLRSQCLANTSSSHEGMLLYLFEHNTSVAYTGLAPWKDPMILENNIRQLGPGHFASFPAHHFFARVYRPAAIITALLNRKPTFCGDPEWIATPWERHPKAPLDRLLDILSQIPSLLQRLDHLLSLDPTMARRLMAQDLLENCLSVQAALEQWHNSLHQSHYRSQAPYWISPNQSEAQLPFTNALSFYDSLTSITFLYYWTAQILFFPCIELLSHTIFSPVVDTYPQVYPELPPHLHIDPESYGPNKTREIASNICRGLDSALASTAQPDLLAFPVQMVETFYGGLNVVAQTGEGTLELMWLVGFRTRMVHRGQNLAGAVMGKEWSDLAEW